MTEGFAEVIPTLDKLLECAVCAARAAGDHAFTQAARRGEVIQRFAHDYKLKLDYESQAKAEGTIRSFFPDHDILGEESQNTGSESDMWLGFADSSDSITVDTAASRIMWIIDPIDGTVNFRHGLPLWCSAVAACVGGKTVAGAVYAPALGECYTAAADRPALCNGKLIEVSETDRMCDAMIATGLNYNKNPATGGHDSFGRIVPHSHKVRVLGSAAMDLCYVARGCLEGYFEASVFTWDVAAGGLIVRQAGGRAEVLAKQPASHRLSFMATNGHIHDELKTLISPTL